MIEKLLVNVKESIIPDHQRDLVSKWTHENNQTVLSRIIALVFGFDIALYMLISFFQLMKVKEGYIIIYPAIIGILFCLIVAVNIYYLKFPEILGFLSVNVVILSRVIYFVYLKNTTNAYFMFLGTFMLVSFLYMGYREGMCAGLLSILFISFVIGMSGFQDFNDLFLFIMIAFIAFGFSVFSKLKYINAVEALLRINDIEEINAKLSLVNENYERELKNKSTLLQKTKEAETMFRQLTEMVNSSVILVDHEDKIKYMNDIFKGMLKSNHVRNIRDLKDVFSPLCYGQMMEVYNRVKMGRMAGYIHNVNCINFNDRDIWMDMKLTPIDLDNAHYILISGVDISEMKEKELNIKRLSEVKDVILSINHATTRQLDMNDYFRYVLDSIMEVLPHAKLGSVLIRDGEILRIVNAVGYNNEKVLNFELPIEDSYMYRQTSGQFEETEIINNIQYILKPELNVLRQNEEDLVVESSICAPIFIDAELYGFISFESDENYIFDNYDVDILNYIREQVAIAIKNQHLYQKTLSLSKYDQLTGFFNRWYRGIDRDFASQWERYNQQIMFVVVDINNLKEVNDAFGHLVGDLYIKTFAEQVEAAFRSSDIFIRMGGDEFLGIIHSISREDLRFKLEELNKTLTETTEIEDLHLKLSFSYGLSEYGVDGESFDGLFRIADKKMYQYKMSFKEKEGL